MRLVFVSLVVTAAALGPAQTVLLRYRPPVGKTVSYTIVNAMSMTSPAPMSFTQTVPTTLRVLSKTGNATTIEMKSGPTRMNVPAGSPMTGLAKNPSMSKVNVVRMTIDEFGTPKGATGSGVASAMASSMSAAMGGGAQGVFFPTKPVKVGDTWTSSLDIGKLVPTGMAGMKMNGKIPIVYRLTALSGGVATVAMTAKGAMSMAMGAKPMQIAMDIRSTILLDAATGLTKSMSTTTDTTTTLPGVGAMHQHMASTMR